MVSRRKDTKMTEQELADQIKNLQAIKKQNKEVDVSSLALSALQNYQVSMLTPKEKRIAYLVSLGLPPAGLFYAAKFFFSDKSDGKTAAYMCLVLTLVSVIAFFAFSGALFSGSGLTPAQIKQAPADWQSLVQ